jgi:pentatricopeptide repeat protein
MRARQPEKAEATLDEMLARGLQPNVIFFSTIVTGWCITGQMDRAVKVLDKMRATGVRPVPDVFAILIRGYMQAELPTEAEGVLALMEREGLEPDKRIYDLLISELTRLGYPSDVWRLTQQARRKLGSANGAEVNGSGGVGTAAGSAPLRTSRSFNRVSATGRGSYAESSSVALGSRPLQIPLSATVRPHLSSAFSGKREVRPYFSCGKSSQVSGTSLLARLETLSRRRSQVVRQQGSLIGTLSTKLQPCPVSISSPLLEIGKAAFSLPISIRTVALC